MFDLHRLKLFKCIEWKRKTKIKKIIIFSSVFVFIAIKASINLTRIQNYILIFSGHKYSIIAEADNFKYSFSSKWEWIDAKSMQKNRREQIFIFLMLNDKELNEKKVKN